MIQLSRLPSELREAVVDGLADILVRDYELARGTVAEGSPFNRTHFAATAQTQERIQR